MTVIYSYDYVFIVYTAQTQRSFMIKKYIAR